LFPPPPLPDILILVGEALSNAFSGAGRMNLKTRRSFNRKMLGSILAYGLIETLAGQDLFAEAVKPVVHKWLVELNDLCRDVKGHQLKDVDFQGKLEELYRRVDLPELLRFVDLDRLSDQVQYPARGSASLGVDLSRVEGLPTRLVFGKQIFACRKGRSIVPHGHDNMCTGFVVLRGTWQGKHYERIEDHKDHYLIKPTIDRAFGPGESSTVSDHKDNVHWFKAESDSAFIFNIHVLGYNPENPNPSGRVYVDPEGEKVAGGLILAKKMTSAACHKKYG
jgi:hypothetical protein